MPAAIQPAVVHVLQIGPVQGVQPMEIDGDVRGSS